MIGILQNKNLTPKKMREIEEWHWEKIRELINKKKTKKHISFIEKIIQPITFKDIVLAKYDTLSKNKTDINIIRINKYKAYENFFKKLYEKYRNTYGKRLVEKLEMTVCPYCNRNFINNGQKYATAQFDHFFSKSSYPIFALSLYNLIPSCATCNKLKSTHEFTLSPYDKSQTTDKIVQFSYLPVTLNSYSIEIKPLVDEMKTNVDMLQLSGLYEMHNKMVNQLIFKQQQYNKIYRTYLQNYTNGVAVNTNMSLKELYYGNYLTEDKYYLKPLSKFTKDIIEEIEKLAIK